MSSRALRKFERLLYSARQNSDEVGKSTTLGHIEYDFKNQTEIYTPAKIEPDKKDASQTPAASL